MAERTALILIDVYNDFLHPKGKLTAALSASLTHFKTIEHLKQAVSVARSVNIPVYYSLHQQYYDGKFTGFEHWNPMLRSLESSHSFEEGSFGVGIYEGLEPDSENGDVVISKHWNQSSFHNTDLDWLLRQRDITHVVFAGLVANSCIETTARMANEHGYKVTMLFVKCLKDLIKWKVANLHPRSDATAGWTVESTNATVEYSWPAFAHEIMTTNDWEQQYKLIN